MLQLFFWRAETHRQRRASPPTAEPSPWWCGHRCRYRRPHPRNTATAPSHCCWGGWWWHADESDRGSETHTHTFCYKEENSNWIQKSLSTSPTVLCVCHAVKWSIWSRHVIQQGSAGRNIKLLQSLLRQCILKRNVYLFSFESCKHRLHVFFGKFTEAYITKMHHNRYFLCCIFNGDFISIELPEPKKIIILIK